MDNLTIEGSWKSPHVVLGKNGDFEIWGRSLPENAIDVYTPVFEWLDAYAKTPADQTNVDVKLEYFNTSSSKLLYEIFKRFERLHQNGNKILVKWYYEEDDSDLEEEGKMFSELVNVPIEMISIEEFDFSFT